MMPEPTVSTLRSICVFCGSRMGADPAFRKAARELGAEIARRGLRLVYGGGKVGLMGEVMSAAVEHGADVLGVIPDFLLDAEKGMVERIDTRVVTSMHDRKRIMFDESDAFLVLPGGVGTLEELVETLSWVQLGLHGKPIVLIDVNGFWRPFLDLLKHIRAQDLMAAIVAEKPLVAANAIDALDQAARYAKAAAAKPSRL